MESIYSYTHTTIIIQEYIPLYSLDMCFLISFQNIQYSIFIFNIQFKKYILDCRYKLSRPNFNIYQIFNIPKTTLNA